MVMNKRRRILIKRAFQLRYVGAILFFVLLITLISTITIYAAIFPYLSEKLANVYPQGRLVMVLRNANMKVLMSTAVVLPIAVWVGIMFSHRIAGPWYRMEVILREIAEGSLTARVNLRKGDELQSLGDAINEVTDNLRAMAKENVEYIDSLDSTLKSFENELRKESLDAIKAGLLLSKIHDISKDLRESLKRHRLS